MALGERTRKARPVIVTFSTVALLSILALGVLSWQLLQKDRELEAPRLRGLTEAAADRAVPLMTAAVENLDALAAGQAADAVPNGVSIVHIAADSATVSSAASPLPFVPVRPRLPEADGSVFAEANALELRKNDVSSALAAYEKFAGSRDGAIRAAALSRLAPLRARTGDLAGALRDYDALNRLDASVGGLPAGLVAAAGRATLLAAHRDASALKPVATELAADLARGRWPLTRSEYEYYAGQADVWLGRAPSRDTDAVVRAEAAALVWSSRAQLPGEGRRLFLRPGGAALVVWRSAADHMSLAVAGNAFVGALVKSAVPAGFTATLRDLEGRVVVGPASAPGEPATRLASPTGLPWTVELRAQPAANALQNPIRRRLLLLVVLTTMISVGAGWYFIARSLRREARAAALQQSFVASVSHEFRSPLTSIAHVADLLLRERLPSTEQRAHAYRILASDAARLHEMVENLLDFSRFDAGTVSLHCEQVDAGALVEEVVDDARRRVAPDGYTIEFSRPAEPVPVRADRTALARAVWNLIENAVKYSPEFRTVWVDVTREGDRAAIAVRDRGLGIPANEHDAIFRRFVRGAEPAARQIRGTGIGLALVRQVVEAHGGQVQLTSSPGQGSRFTVLLQTSGDAA
jgi:signal transduction histidine kinase